jgi:phosphate transport system protein
MSPLFRTASQHGLDTVERTIREMLDDDRHAFDAATSTLLASAPTETVGPDLLETDRRVNAAERTVRRELVVHASVSGPADLPAMLAYMSIVKDVERIGDYAKNIFDLANTGVDLSAATDHADLVAIRDRVSQLIGETAEALAERDEDRAWQLSREGDGMLDDFDVRVDALIVAEDPARFAVPRALYFRHCKRIVAHLMNVLSSIVMPLDRLDYFDEDRATRSALDEDE